MQIKINREILLKPLNSVTSIVERRHTLPILSNLLLEAKNNQIQLTATDLEMQISLHIEAPLEGNFSTTISAKKTAGYLPVVARKRRDSYAEHR